MDKYEGSKYFTSSDEVRNTLEEFGVAVVPGILSSKECDDMMDGTWKYLETITSKFDTPISREFPETWRQITKLFPINSMLIQHWKIGHAQYIWDLRQNEKIIDIFSRIWETKHEDLLVSFDGASVHFPPEITNIGWERSTPGLHCDQSFTRNDFECVQSWISANDTNPGDATLAFYEKSHKHHKEFAKTFDHKKDDWHKLDDLENKFYTESCGEYKSITCPKGSLVLWDSRLIHCGQRAIKGRLSQNIRSVAYMCYTKRSLASEANLKKKRLAFSDMRMTTHNPGKIKLFPKTPRTYGAPLPDVTDIDSPKLNDLGTRLAGF